MASFTEEFTRMRQDFDQAQADRDRLYHDTREHVQNMAQGVKQQLAGFRQHMQDMHDEIAEMAGHVRAGLKEMSTDLHGGGNVFRKGSSPKAKARKSRINLPPRHRSPSAVAADGHPLGAVCGRGVTRPTTSPSRLRPAYRQRKPSLHDQATATAKCGT